MTKLARFGLVVLVLLFAGVAIAAIVKKESPATVELRNSTGQVISTHTSYAECFNAAEEIGQYVCVTQRVITVEGNCSDVPAPPDPVVNGFTVQGTVTGRICPGGNNYYFTQVQKVAGQHPNCWVDADVQISQCSDSMGFWDPTPGDFTPPVSP